MKERGIDGLASIQERKQKLIIEESLAIEKAFLSNDPNTIYKAQQHYNKFIAKYQPGQTNGSGMKAMTLDPFEATSSMGYFNKHANLSWDVLRNVARAPIIKAIIVTRISQVVEYCKVQPDKYSKGFKLFKVGVEDEDELKDSDKKYRDYLNQFILNCGEDKREWEGDDFDNWIKKIVADSLILDSACSEVQQTRGFEPYSFKAVDAGTIRFADTHDDQVEKEGALKVNGYPPYYVQLWMNRICAEFYPWEMMYGIRNPSSAINSNGYGRSELEDLVTTVTSMLNADTYNRNYFKNGMSTKGILALKKGHLDPSRMAEFQKDWRATTSGSENAHKTLVIDAESMEWIDTAKSNKDMEFGKYQEYLIKLGCAAYKISPEEIGFPLEGTGKSGLGNGSGKDEKEYSINKGLKPLLTELQQWINKWIIYPKTGKKWEFRFVGYDIETAAEEEEKIQKAVTLYLTPDEVRAQKNMKPLPNGMGKLPLNPIIAQMTLGQQQAKDEKEAKQGEEEDQARTNKNPFLDDENPFAKGFDAWIEENLIVKA